jgi:hypothetical protein
MIVAAFLAWGLALFTYPTARGFFLGMAAFAKFSPLILIPLWIRADRRRSGERELDPDEWLFDAQLAPPVRASRRRRLLDAVRPGPGSGRVLLGGVLALLVAFLPLVALDGIGGLTTFWDRTFGWQLDRPSPFSIWDWGSYPGFPDLAIEQKALKGALVLLAIALWFLPRRLDIVRVAALSGALLVGFQILLTHWHYLYVPWWIPFLALGLFAERPAAEPRREPELAGDEPPATSLAEPWPAPVPQPVEV